MIKYTYGVCSLCFVSPRQTWRGGKFVAKPVGGGFFTKETTPTGPPRGYCKSTSASIIFIAVLGGLANYKYYKASELWRLARLGVFINIGIVAGVTPCD